MARLYRDRLVVNLVGEDAESAERVGVPQQYVILLTTSPQRLLEIDATLARIFAGVGDYQRQF
jgi:hypothetical protein